MLDEYYGLHGWDKETSFPTQKALEALGLEDVAADLKNIGKLGSTPKS
jgi:aldehyde:ferredoxin oxidoreductase